MSKTGQAAALSKISLTLSITSVEAKPENAATATALPNTSCAHVIAANGAIDNTCDIRRNSRLSRGRSIKRWPWRVGAEEAGAAKDGFGRRDAARPARAAWI